MNMKQQIKEFINVLKYARLNPFVVWTIYANYKKDYKKLKKELKTSSDFSFGKSYPVLIDKYSEAGRMSGDYFHQDLLVARRVFNNNPKRHIDIGSRTDGFVAHVASFREIEVLDIRFQESSVKNVIFRQADLMNIFDDLVESCDSVSSLHAIEHFGLGRYGDPIDANGHLKAIHNIHKMLLPGGKFYFSGPIGPQRIEFNAHRVYSISYLLDIFKNLFEIEQFSYVDDSGKLFEAIDLTPNLIKSNCNCTYGCGIFELRKK